MHSPTNKVHHPPSDKEDFSTPLSDIQISLEDITLRLKKMNPNKAPGPDNQHPCVFRELYGILDVPLLRTFRKSLENGCLHESWKQAKITPIHKNWSRSFVQQLLASPALHVRLWNLSLESILCSIWKITASLCEHQHKFPPGRSAITQLLEVLDDWFSFYDENTCVDAIYLDFSKARILWHYRKGYIMDHRVPEQRETSCMCKRDCFQMGQSHEWGTPGSVLSPVIFIFYINSLPDSITNYIKRFADDSKLWTPVKTIEDCEALQNADYSAPWMGHLAVKISMRRSAQFWG